MDRLLTFMTACVVLAIANAFTTALGIALLFAALLGAISHPRQTFGLAFALGMVALALKQPLACVAALGTLGLAIIITDKIGRRVMAAPAPPVLLLPHTHAAPEQK